MDKKTKKHKRLTIAELRKFRGFDSISDEEAENTISTLEKLSVLFYSLYKKQQVIKENNSNNKKKEKKDEEQRGAA